jgi:hypothetical protein
MSLDVAEWKRVLDQPKNLGLKAGGGTGISELLRKVDQARAAFDVDKQRGASEAERQGGVFIKALEVLVQKSKEVKGKHGKVFTTACQYLDTQVVSAAERKIRETREIVAEIKNRERVLKEGKTGIETHCKAAKQQFEQAKDIQELLKLWATYKTGLLTKINQYENALGRPGAFRNDLTRMNGIRFDERNGPALDFWRKKLAAEAEMMSSPTVTPYQ